MFGINLKSIENVSAKRRFVAVFGFMSVLPFVVLTALFVIFYSTGYIYLEKDLFLWIMVLIGVSVIFGFSAMYRILSGLSKVSSNIKETSTKKAPRPIDVKVSGDNEIAQIARSFNATVSKLEATIKELEHAKAMIQEIMVNTASGVSFMDNINAFIDLILKTTVKALYAQSGILLLIDENSNDLVISNCFGPRKDGQVKGRHLPLDSEIFGTVIKQKNSLVIPLLQKPEGPPAKETGSLFQPPFICSPLIFHNKAIGVILINGRENDDNFKEDELLALSNVSTQLALAIMNARLNADAEKTYMETIAALALAVEARDVYSRGHSDRVGIFATKIAGKLGLSEQQVKIVKEAAQLHDVGKIGISDEILKKPAKLDDLEWEIMRDHPAIGEGIIAPLRNFSSLRDPIRHHHEWINGEGYPDHLKGDQISIEAKILSVADSLDAMTSDRPYRKAMSFEEAKKDLLKYKGTRYDPKVVDAAIEIIGSQ